MGKSRKDINTKRKLEKKSTLKGKNQPVAGWPLSKQIIN
jgi:hypothetical protein